MAAKQKLKQRTPSGATLRSPLSLSKQNGDFVNPPRFPDFGGMTGPNVQKRNGYTLKPTGDVK